MQAFGSQGSGLQRASATESNWTALTWWKNLLHSIWAICRTPVKGVMSRTGFRNYLRESKLLDLVIQEYDPYVFIVACCDISFCRIHTNWILIPCQETSPILGCSPSRDGGLNETVRVLRESNEERANHSTVSVWADGCQGRGYLSDVTMDISIYEV